MKLLLIIFVFFISLEVSAQTFDELIAQVDKHSHIKSIKSGKQAIEEEGKQKSKWAETQLKLDATNFPSENIQMGESPMTGLGLTISKKIPLTSKYSNIEKSYNSLAEVNQYKSEIYKRRIILGVWNHAIEKRNIIEAIEVYNENLKWVDGMIKVSNKLYTTGIISQQAILDLKIRKSQIKSSLKTKEILLSKLNANLSKLLDLPNDKIDLHLNTVPWDLLNNYLIEQSSDTNNPQQLLLVSKVSALSYKEKADSLNKTPEVNVGFNYRYRDNIDRHGDFIGAFISIPISNGIRSAQYRSSSHRHLEAQSDLQAYQNELASLKEELKLEIEKLESELNILMSETIIFARTSRDIVSKSYAVGKSDYLELLRSELQLQDFLLKKIGIEAKLKTNKILYLYETGMNIY